MTRLVDSNQLAGLTELLAAGRVLVLSGAGLSTDSGIPDYRGPTGAARRATPMTYQVFTSDASARRRYWARSHLGWRVIGRARPNEGHAAVTRLQHIGALTGVLTQNVDGLHTAAGTQGVLELHGALARVVCLDCGARTARIDLDRRLTVANSGWRAAADGVLPDGDVDLAESDLDGFTVVACQTCDGMLKPDVVFFGETVPPDRVQAGFALVQRSAGVLVLGSSLTVMSGYRFVLRARKQGIAVAVVNDGPTRADDAADLRVHGRLGAVLPELARRLAG